MNRCFLAAAFLCYMDETIVTGTADWQEPTQPIITIKAAGDWELDVLGIPYGNGTNRDSDNQYFDHTTRLHEDKYPLPPVVYYHGFDETGRPSGEPAYIGKSVSYEDRPDGRWYHVVLDRANEYAGRVWQAAKDGIARASSGSVSHLVRYAADGRITEWPVAELSVFDAVGNRQPANQYAVALPRMKSIIEKHPEFKPEGETENAGKDDGGILLELETKQKEVIKMSEQDKDTTVQAVDLGPVLEAIKGIGVQVKDIAGRVEAMEAKPDNDPGIAAKGVNVVMDTEHWKYDHLSPGDLALGIAMLTNGERAGRSRRGPSDAAIKALSMRLESSDRKENEGYQEAYGLMKRAYPAIKANELGRSTLAGGGDEWVGVAYGTAIWESIRTGTPILERQMVYAVPQPAGAESLVFPLEGADPTWYLMPQAASLSSNPGGVVTNTATASTIGTAKQDRTLAKIAARVLYTGELEEDAVISVVSQYRQQLAASGMEMLESLLIDGDTETGASTNINDIAGTPGGSEYWLGLNGYRKLALVTNTANSRDGGSLTEDDFLETLKMMGVAGKNAMQKDRTAFLTDLHTYWKALTIPSVKTRDVNSAATVENGDLTRIWGHDVLASENFHAPSAGSGYELKAQTDGKIDQDTASDNVTGSILAVRFDQWKPGYRRQMTLETTRFAAADATEIVAILRFGMIYRDTEASAITYNVSV